MTITHGILVAHGTFDLLIHEMDEITKNDATRENKTVDWSETRVFDNSNRGRYQSLAIHREPWK